MKKFISWIFGNRYKTASDQDIRNAEFHYTKALKDLKDYDAGKLKNIDITAGTAALQDYFRRTKGNLTPQ